jgi:plastocyanin
MHRLTLAAGLLMVVALAACGSASAGQPSAQPSVDPSSPRIVAQSIAFDRSEVDVAAGQAFQLVFENRDQAPHNVAIYATPDFKDPVSVGEILSSPGIRVQAVAALAAGTYFFRCDVHPDMKGTIVAR